MALRVGNFRRRPVTTETLLLRPRAYSIRRWKVEGGLGKSSQKIASDIVVWEREGYLEA